MNLIIFDKSNTSTVSRRIGERTVRMNTKGGIVTFSTLAIIDLGLKPDMNIVFAKDKDKQRTWFIGIDEKNNNNSFNLKYDKKMKAVMRSTGLVRKVVEDFKEVKSIKFLIAKEAKEVQGMKFYQLIPYK